MVIKPKIYPNLAQDSIFAAVILKQGLILFNFYSSGLNVVTNLQFKYITH